MPLQLFIVLVFGIFGFLSVGLIEPLMRNFADETDIARWLFVAIPGLFAMLIALFAFRKAAERVPGMRDALERALLVALFTWIAVAALIASVWCPLHSALTCVSKTLIVTAVVAGGPFAIGMALAGLVAGTVLRKRVSWLSYEGFQWRRAPKVEPPRAE